MTLSVALCTFRGAAWLPAQLASVAAQTRPPDELVVGDDGSDDGTVAAVETFAASARFPVRLAVRPTRLGPTANFDAAVAGCTGDVVVLCDQDDVWRPDKLERLAAAFADPAVGLAFSDAHLAGPDLTPTGRRAWAELGFDPTGFGGDRAFVRLLKSNVVTGAAAAFRADLRAVIRPIPAGWWHDWWIALAAAAVSDVAPIAEPLLTYRRHPGQAVGLARRSAWARFRKAATGLDAAHFLRQAGRFDELHERLSGFRGRVRSPAVFAALADRRGHARRQAAMRRMSRPGRLWAAAGELAAGRYHRFGHGWPGFAADAVL